MTGLVANPPNAFYSSTKFAMEALTEALAKEVAPFGIKVTASSRARSAPTGPSARCTSRATRSTRTPTTSRVRKDLIKQFADHLPGDPRKVAEAVVMLTGLEKPPLRLLLGHDVLKAVREKLADMTASIDEWEATTMDVNFAPGT